MIVEGFDRLIFSDDDCNLFEETVTNLCSTFNEKPEQTTVRTNNFTVFMTDGKINNIYGAVSPGKFKLMRVQRVKKENIIWDIKWDANSNENLY